jgi:ABC-type lipoprotein release transport system permease subunit
MTDTPHTAPRRVFEDGQTAASRRITLPWRLTVQICWLNVRNRMGRFAMVFAGIAVVVAFLMSSLTYHRLVSGLLQQDDVHVRAVLERAGLFADAPDLIQAHADRQLWLMILSGVLCLVGIANTMLMSVTERIREIGTLKCLGALDRFVVRLFLLESVFVGLIGSLCGAVLGYAFTLLQVGLVLEFSLLSPAFCLQALLQAPVAVGAGTVLTVLAAIYPTRVAARMKPVDAMRVEV